MEVLMKQNWRRVVIGAAATLVASLALAGSASAGVVVKTTTNCANQVLSQPFTRWADQSHYTLMPGASFENGTAGWTLNGGARVTSGNESYKVNGAGDGQSLRLPLGSSAVTAPMCVGLQHPTLRFFAKRNSGLLSTLVVSVRIQLQLGGTLELPVGVVTPNSSWTPSLPMIYLDNLLPLLPGQYTPVSFRFTPLLGDWSVDDVYVDPFHSR
jgi:hypothetical protein